MGLIDASSDFCRLSGVTFIREWDANYRHGGVLAPMESQERNPGCRGHPVTLYERTKLGGDGRLHSGGMCLLADSFTSYGSAFDN